MSFPRRRGARPLSFGRKCSACRNRFRRQPPSNHLFFFLGTFLWPEQPEHRKTLRFRTTRSTNSLFLDIFGWQKVLHPLEYFFRQETRAWGHLADPIWKVAASWRLFLVVAVNARCQLVNPCKAPHFGGRVPFIRKALVIWLECANDFASVLMSWSLAQVKSDMTAPVIHITTLMKWDGLSARQSDTYAILAQIAFVNFSWESRQGSRDWEF